MVAYYDYKPYWQTMETVGRLMVVSINSNSIQGQMYSIGFSNSPKITLPTIINTLKHSKSLTELSQSSLIFL